MAITQVITALPTAPDPATMTAAAFSSAAAASVLAQKAMTPELNTFATQANALATQASADSATATAGAATATTKAAEAAASASTAVNAPGSGATSTTSDTIALGSTTITIQTGKLFGVGQQLVIASTASPTNWMSGTITAHDTGTGSITTNITNISGSGTFAAWTVSLGGAPGFTGVVNELEGAPIATASTIDLDAATGNLVHLTGTTTVTAITLAQGAARQVVSDGVATLTNGASLILPGGANIITAAGDCWVARGEGAGVTRITDYTKADGTAVKAGMALLATITPTVATTVDFLTTFSAAYDSYLIVGVGVGPDIADILAVRVANAGSVDTGSKYYGTTMGTQDVTLDTNVRVSDASILATKKINFQIVVSNVNDATHVKGLTLNSVAQDNATPSFVGYSRWGAYDSANAISGFRLYWTGANSFTATGKIRVYGYNNS